MRFGILGPLEVLDGDRRLTVGGPQQRALLTVLLLHPNRVVSVERLVDHLWCERPPATARSLLQGCVAGLRRVLLLRDEPQWRPLVTRSPGYLLQVRPGELDVDQVEELVAGATAARSEGTREGMERACELLSRALSVWRGPVLEDVAPEVSRAAVTQLQERRWAVLEERIDIDLWLGHHRAVIGELWAHVADQPLREGLWYQLMLALYRADRRADALLAYRQLRQVLVEQLGIEPSATVQRLHRTILSGECANDGQVAVPAAA